MVRNVNQTYSGDHSAIYTNIESLFCTHETNILHDNFISILKKKACNLYIKILVFYLKKKVLVLILRVKTGNKHPSVQNKFNLS